MANKIEDRRPTWWQRKRRPWCAHVLYLDDVTYARLVRLLRLIKALGVRRARPDRD